MNGYVLFWIPGSNMNGSRTIGSIQSEVGGSLFESSAVSRSSEATATSASGLSSDARTSRNIAISWNRFFAFSAPPYRARKHPVSRSR